MVIIFTIYLQCVLLSLSMSWLSLSFCFFFSNFKVRQYGTSFFFFIFYVLACLWNCVCVWLHQFMNEVEICIFKLASRCVIPKQQDFTKYTLLVFINSSCIITIAFFFYYLFIFSIMIMVSDYRLKFIGNLMFSLHLQSCL